MTETVYNWLANYLETTTEGLKEALKEEIATLYLLVFPILEQQCFDGFMLKDKIIDFAKKEQICYPHLNCDEYARYFHMRYQNREYHRNLKGSKEGYFAGFEKILKKDFAKLGNDEKLTVLLYVSYRYRNNIFHGNKGVQSWSKYTEQIEKCLYFMMQFIDYKKSEPV